MRTIRAVLVGMGAMNALVAPLLHERGVEIVGAVGRSAAKIGRDAGDVLGLGRSLGVAVEADAAAVYASREADIALIATRSFLTDVGPQLADCARGGVNAITLAEEMIFPWRTSPTAARALDELARTHGVTLTGGGYQDAFLVNLVASMLGTANRVDRVVGRSSFNVDEYGPEVARDQQIGATVAEFEEWMRNTDRPPTFGANDLHAIASASGLTITEVGTQTRPVLAERPLHCVSLDRIVQPGQLTGFVDVDTVQTAEGPVLSLELAGRLYEPGETDVNEWIVAGDPALHLVNPDVDTQRLTCTQLVNRIPDVINAEPGLVTVDRLPPLRYRPRPLATYLDR